MQHADAKTAGGTSSNFYHGWTFHGGNYRAVGSGGAVSRDAQYAGENRLGHDWGVAAGELVTETQKQVVQEIFDSVGQTIFIEEAYIDAVGAVSGSGPAYMYQILEALADGAVLTGLPRAMAYQLAAQTMAGSAMMLLETGLHPGELKDQVTSPGGTTIRALKVLEEKGVRSAMMEAVQQAYLRSKELGEKK